MSNRSSHNLPQTSPAGNAVSGAGRQPKAVATSGSDARPGAQPKAHQQGAQTARTACFRETLVPSQLPPWSYTSNPSVAPTLGPEAGQQADPLGSSSSPDAHRGGMRSWAMARGLRGLTGRRQALCRCLRIAPTVDLVEAQCRATGERRLQVNGIMVCGSVWSCPMCAARILSSRANEIQRAVDTHGRDRVHMVSLTMRHKCGDDLGVLSGILATAYSSLKGGRDGERLRARWHWVGDVRAVEQTHGVNGWHPHIHALWFTERANVAPLAVAHLTERWARVIRQTVERALDAAVLGYPVKLARIVGQRAVDRLGCDEIARLLVRASLEPDALHGVRVSRVVDGRYLAKMGLSLEAVWQPGKNARQGHRSAWQVATDAASGDMRSRALWAEHHRAMRGRRQLTWSRGLRDLLGLGVELDDSELAADGTLLESEDTRRLGIVVSAVWDAECRDRAQGVWGLLGMAYERGLEVLAEVPGVVLDTLPQAAWRARPVHERVFDPDGATERGRAWYRRASAAAKNQSTGFVSGVSRDEALDEARCKLYDAGLRWPRKTRQREHQQS